MKRTLLFLVWGLASAAPALNAQERAPAARDSAIRASNPVVRVSKWITLAGAAGAAAWGINANRDADQRYSDIERTCQSTPERCLPRTSSGAFTDAQLEQEYQDVLALDRRARLALITAEVSVATSVVLFILDLPRNTRGEDIPYHPPRVQVGASGSRFQLSYRLPF